MKFTSTYIISLLYLLVCCGPAQTDVSLRISPERCQFFQHESISLTCEDEGNSMPGWSVRRQTSERGNGTCDNGWGTIADAGRPCIVQVSYAFDSGAYWCQDNKSGQHSRSIYITISDRDEGAVILKSPVLPVTEGKDVTLRCLYKDKTTSKPSSNLPSAFYTNGSLIRTESTTGQMTIHNVHKSDEGFYKCHISNLGESPESWMDVKDSPASKDNNQSDPPCPSLPPCFCPSLPPCTQWCAGVSIFLLMLGLILGLFLGRKSRDPDCVRPVQSHRTIRGSAAFQRSRTNQSGAPDDAYSRLQHGDKRVIYGVIQQPANYANDPCRVRHVQSQGTNQHSAADQTVNESGAADDAYCPLRLDDTSVYGVIDDNDPCRARPVQSQGTSQGSALDQRTNQSGAPDVYCPLQHGDTSVYEVIQHPDD